MNYGHPVAFLDQYDMLSGLLLIVVVFFSTTQLDCEVVHL